MARSVTASAARSTAAIGFESKLRLLIEGSGSILLPDSSSSHSLPARTQRSVDLLGRVYDYLLTRLASAEGKNGGLSRRRPSPTAMRRGCNRMVRAANTFYTPSCIVRCLIEMLAPYKGRIYDSVPALAVFVQPELLIETKVCQLVESRRRNCNGMSLALAA